MTGNVSYFLINIKWLWEKITVYMCGGGMEKSGCPCALFQSQQKHEDLGFICWTGTGILAKISKVH